MIHVLEIRVTPELTAGKSILLVFAQECRNPGMFGLSIRIGLSADVTFWQLRA